MIKLKNISSRTVLYAILIIYGVVSTYPILLMVLTSFKQNNKEIFTQPFSLPDSFSFSNYTEIFKLARFDLFFRNSFLVTFSSILLIMILSSLAAYILAKYKLKIINILYLYFIIGIMIPIKICTINLVQIMNTLGLFDNLLSLIIINTAVGIPISIFILTQFIRAVPEELSNAARIDGCSDYGIFFKIILPLIRPALSTVAIISFLPIWNDFWFPLILLRSKDLYTVPLAISFYFGQNQTNWGLIFAMLTTASIPIIVFFLIISKQFVRGLSEGAFKG